MMNKERELLNRSRYNLDREYCADLIDEIQELLAQPEFLTPRQGLKEYKRGYARAELDLKREPIKGGELKVWYSQHTWAMDEQEYTWGFRAYMAGFRDAEKMHGIGGGE